MAKTRDEIDRLKRQWLGDPTWDIEATEGFEDHRDELAAYAEAQREKWKNDRVRRLLDLADRLGCPGNLRLANYIEWLERRIEGLEEFRDGGAEVLIERRIDARAGKYDR